MSATEPRDANDTIEELDAEELRTQLAILREENERLRDEYARARQTSYRRTAAALAGIGVLAVALGGLLIGVREVLFVIGAIGLFGGILTWYLTPERVLTVGVSESIYTALAANGAQLREELGLQPTTVYTSVGSGVRAFLPQQQEFTLPDEQTGVFQTEDDASRGITLTPAGDALVTEFEQMQTEPTLNSLREAAVQFGDALVEQFEIADAVTVTESTSDDRVVVTIEDPAFGSLTSFDHPAVSILACGLARTQDDPILVDPIDDTTVAFETGTPD